MFLKTISSRFSQIGRLSVTQSLYKSTQSTSSGFQCPKITNEHQQNRNEQNESTQWILYASIPTFLAFFKKKEDENDKSDKTFLDALLGEELAYIFSNF